MRCALQNNSDKLNVSRCKFCYKPYYDIYKETWGNSIHFCGSPQCTEDLNQRHAAKKKYYVRDAPDMWNWMKNNPSVRGNPAQLASLNPLEQPIASWLVINVKVQAAGNLVVELVFKREEIWRKDGNFTTKFTRFLSQYVDPMYTISFVPLTVVAA